MHTDISHRPSASKRVRLPLASDILTCKAYTANITTADAEEQVAAEEGASPNGATEAHHMSPGQCSYFLNDLSLTLQATGEVEERSQEDSGNEPLSQSSSEESLDVPPETAWDRQLRLEDEAWITMERMRDLLVGLTEEDLVDVTSRPLQELRDLHDWYRDQVEGVLWVDVDRLMPTTEEFDEILDAF